MISVQNVTKKFSNGKGLFDITFQVKEGEVFGYLGPNGAGKSTTIRNLMGFIKPTAGHAEIFGLDCWNEAAKIQREVGYLPGEISFIEGMNGLEFLKLMQGMRGLKDVKRRDELIERLQFDVKTPIRKMSKGMKQKVGIVAAFMHDPEVLILDEPTSGLDPLMQQIFIDLILEEKQKGKTILMSSHIFTEIERTCDRVAIIKDGRLVTVENIHDLQGMRRQVMDVTVSSQVEMRSLQKENLHFEAVKENTASIIVQGNYQEVLQTLARYNVKALQTRAMDLEHLFMHYYDAKEGVKHE
ncbi:ABC transporter ATP-binding protein [Bacillus pseudomycoides]|uniref:ABC transporter ATP-binding protein n=1 Tax=Bacillus pseudomycoides TaxID=64104 RepID=UPI000BEDBB9B|nr:ABC transporter ATP-binding protein [Bacillus pseudomycoides]PDY02011.1 ABC transporter ATP-binding protein [Bacillus pseudomycoides]PEK81899.1 ABC transporter ATP-binding protein [Bacillus pseudomycoides]PEN06407.1 ABC transporter ATP-binding protein [Bacillus pseudomycoides]PGB78738.1 ABC transporter ATP-binding protein [Bacillus pseudomycoides]PHE54927.1 ABC transporter ATP-binding protein [Bacillus pseudomycoides]